MHRGSSRISKSQDGQVCHIRFLTKMTLQSYLARKDKKKKSAARLASVGADCAWVDSFALREVLLLSRVVISLSRAWLPFRERVEVDGGCGTEERARYCIPDARAAIAAFAKYGGLFGRMR